MVRFSWVLLYSSGLNVYVGRSPRSPSCMYVCMYYNHGRSTSRVAITVQSQGQVKTDMQGQVTVITHMIQRSLTCRYPIYIENTTTYNIYNVRRSAVHTYWNWVSMLMLMLLERIIYFVFVFRMLLPFFHTRK